jgi:hypothetical protein
VTPNATAAVISVEKSRFFFMVGLVYVVVRWAD